MRGSRARRSHHAGSGARPQERPYSPSTSSGSRLVAQHRRARTRRRSSTSTSAATSSRTCSQLSSSSSIRRPRVNAAQRLPRAARRPAPDGPAPTVMAGSTRSAGLARGQVGGQRRRGPVRAAATAGWSRVLPHPAAPATSPAAWAASSAGQMRSRSRSRPIEPGVPGHRQMRSSHGAVRRRGPSRGSDRPGPRGPEQRRSSSQAPAVQLRAARARARRRARRAAGPRAPVRRPASARSARPQSPGTRASAALHSRSRSGSAASAASSVPPAPARRARRRAAPRSAARTPGRAALEAAVGLAHGSSEAGRRAAAPEARPPRRGARPLRLPGREQVDGLVGEPGEPHRVDLVGGGEQPVAAAVAQQQLGRCTAATAGFQQPPQAPDVRVERRRRPRGDLATPHRLGQRVDAHRPTRVHEEQAEGGDEPGPADRQRRALAFQDQRPQVAEPDRARHARPTPGRPDDRA